MSYHPQRFGLLLCIRGIGYGPPRGKNVGVDPDRSSEGKGSRQDHRKKDKKDPGNGTEAVPAIHHCQDCQHHRGSHKEHKG